MQVIVAINMGNGAGVIEFMAALYNNTGVCKGIVRILLGVLEAISSCHFVEPGVVVEQGSDPCFTLGRGHKLFLRIFRCNSRNHAEAHQHAEQQCDEFFHVVSSYGYTSVQWTFRY